MCVGRVRSFAAMLGRILFLIFKNEKGQSKFCRVGVKVSKHFLSFEEKKMEVFIRNFVQKHDDDVINGHHRDHQSGLDGDDHEVT